MKRSNGNGFMKSPIEEKPQTRPYLSTLPDDYLLLIGLVMVRWSLLENALRRVAAAALDLTEAHGRIAIRSARAKEMVEMIRDIALIDGYTVGLHGLNMVEELENRRNLLAHGIWFDGGESGPLLQDLQGHWPKNGDKPKIKRRIIPAGAPISIWNLNDLLAAIETTTLNTYDVGRAIQERLEAYPRKRPSQLRREASQVDLPT